MYICVHVYIRVCVCNIHVCVHPYFSETGPLSELGVNWFVEGLDTDHRGSSSLSIPVVLGLLTCAVRPGLCDC